MEFEAIKTSTELTGKWNKIGGEWVDVRIFGFAQSTVGDSGQIRPVAIVQEGDQCLKYVDLKYLKVDR